MTPEDLLELDEGSLADQYFDRYAHWQSDQSLISSVKLDLAHLDRLDQHFGTINMEREEAKIVLRHLLQQVETKVTSKHNK